MFAITKSEYGLFFVAECSNSRCSAVVVCVSTSLLCTYHSSCFHLVPRDYISVCVFCTTELKLLPRKLIHHNHANYRSSNPHFEVSPKFELHIVASRIIPTDVIAEFTR